MKHWNSGAFPILHPIPGDCFYFWLYENPVPVAGLDSLVLSKWLEYLCQEVTIN